jgi:hypothetical protein
MTTPKEKCTDCLPPFSYATKFSRIWNVVKTPDSGAVTGSLLACSVPAVVINADDIALDPTKTYLYVSTRAGFGGSGGGTLRRIKISDMSNVSYNPSAGINETLAVASNGDVIIGPGNIFGASLLRLDSSGGLIWTASPPTFLNGAAVGPAGGIYVCWSNVAGTGSYSSSGTFMWSKSHGTGSGATKGITVNATQVCTVGAVGVAPSIGTTRVFNLSGTLQWTTSHGATVYATAFLSNGDIVTVGDVSSGVTTRCYDSSGSPKWTANHTASVQAVCVDQDDNVYTGGYYVGDGGDVRAANGYTTRKYKKDGTLLWSSDYTMGNGYKTGNFGTQFGVLSLAVDNAGFVYQGGNPILL